MTTRSPRAPEDLRFAFRYSGIALWVSFYLQPAEEEWPEFITIAYCDVMSAMALGAMPGEVLPED